jgi:uncharacterized protein YdaU (DUF1376 family)
MEDLAYRRLIDQYYLDECPLKGAPSLIARRIGMSDFSSDVQYILETFFEKDDELWISKRCDDEIAKYRLKADSARNANRIKSEKITALKSELKSEPNQLLTKNQEPLTKNHINTTAPKVATPEGVSVDLWNDFLVYRKRLKAPVTDRVLARLIKEAELAKMPLDQVLETIIFKGWRSFEASWITQAAQKAKELPLGTNEQIETAYRQELGKDPAQARFGSYFEMRNYIIEQREKRSK